MFYKFVQDTGYPLRSEAETDSRRHVLLWDPLPIGLISSPENEVLEKKMSKSFDSTQDDGKTKSQQTRKSRKLPFLIPFFCIDKMPMTKLKSKKRTCYYAQMT